VIRQGQLGPSFTREIVNYLILRMYTGQTNYFSHSSRDTLMRHNRTGRSLGAVRLIW